MNLTPQQEIERERLVAWMEKNDIKVAALAERLGLHLTHVYNFHNGRRGITESFKWRFATRYGVEVAAELFAVATPVPVPTPESNSTHELDTVAA